MAKGSAQAKAPGWDSESLQNVSPVGTSETQGLGRAVSKRSSKDLEKITTASLSLYLWGRWPFPVDLSPDCDPACMIAQTKANVHRRGEWTAPQPPRTQLNHYKGLLLAPHQEKVIKTMVGVEMARHLSMATQREVSGGLCSPSQHPTTEDKKGRERVSSLEIRGHPFPTCRSPRTGEAHDPTSEKGVGEDLVWGSTHTVSKPNDHTTGLKLKAGAVHRQGDHPVRDSTRASGSSARASAPAVNGTC